MRVLSCVLFVFSAGVVVAADAEQLFNGKNLDGWKTKASGKMKSEVLTGKTEAFDGRFKVIDGELVIDPKVKGNRYIETIKPVGGNFTITMEFKPAKGCNNDLLFLGTKFDIKEGLKGLKFEESNTLQIAVKDGVATYTLNGENAGTKKTKGDKGPFTLRAEFGAIAIQKLQIEG